MIHAGRNVLVYENGNPEPAHVQVSDEKLFTLDQNDQLSIRIEGNRPIGNNIRIELPDTLQKQFNEVDRESYPNCSADVQHLDGYDLINISKCYPTDWSLNIPYPEGAGMSALTVPNVTIEDDQG